MATIVACGSTDTIIRALPGSEADGFTSVIEQFQLGPLPSIPYPDDNRFNPDRISLGQMLFFDPITGGESAPWVKVAAGLDPYRDRANDVACATCHVPAMAFTDSRRLGAGVSGARIQATDLGPARIVPGRSLVTGMPVGAEPRNSPTILNAAFNGRGSSVPVAKSFQFMDGRVTGGLDEVVTMPITSRDEMAGDAYGIDLKSAGGPSTAQDSVVQRIRRIPAYVELFRRAFVGEIDTADDITIRHFGRALGAFARELITPNARYDQFVSGDFSVFGPQEKLGFQLFFGKALCGNCHSGPMLSDYTFRVQGVGDEYESILPGFEGKNGLGSDFGRFHADSVMFSDSKFAFRVLTVRNAELTAPFFHSGSGATLQDVMDFYNRGGRGPRDISDATLAAAGVRRDASITPLGLNPTEMDAIIAFIKTTTARVQQGPPGVDLTAVPQRVPSGLVPPGVPTPNGPGPYFAAPN
jgi:cytochrome c peroxidase